MAHSKHDLWTMCSLHSSGRVSLTIFWFPHSQHPHIVHFWDHWRNSLLGFILISCWINQNRFHYFVSTLWMSISMDVAFFKSLPVRRWINSRCDRTAMDSYIGAIVHRKLLNLLTRSTSLLMGSLLSSLMSRRLHKGPFRCSRQSDTCHLSR